MNRYWLVGGQPKMASMEVPTALCPGLGEPITIATSILTGLIGRFNPLQFPLGRTGPNAALRTSDRYG